ncbi:zinc-ribbon domain containing protein [Candidatus Falkowbacteria bacterium]|nr:zinc-ribbon domain containing protein [Candidatus Falkowbacteria bacterium]
MPTCKNCNQPFTITESDRQFYHKLNVPEPTHCPDCRTQRRMAVRNEKTLCQRTCDRCNKNVLSMYSSDQPFPVYCRDCWYGDAWGAENYAQEYDWSRPFFEQFAELQGKIPRPSTLGNGLIVNSDYCNYLGDAKNSYLCFGSIFIENCLYGNPYYSKDCVDSFLIRDCELCYQCITSEHLYNCFYCLDCFDSNNLYFCYDCKGCSECFGCAGLRNVKYHLFNQAVGEAEYRKFFGTFDFCNPENVAAAREKLRKNTLAMPHRYYQGVRNVNVSGNYINESKNTLVMFDVKRCEDSNYCAQVIDLKDCYDNNFTEENELCCDYISSWKNYRTLYSISCYQCSNVYYSDLCEGSGDLFGCCGLRKKHFCILNKQYTEAEYRDMVAKIIEQMSAQGGSALGGKTTGEWGEFFPVHKSLFAYNETVAQEYFPLTKEQALSKGWAWKDPDLRDYQPQTYTVPAQIADVQDDVLQALLACQSCRKNFKITKQELEFYRKFNLPVPSVCWFCRHLERMLERNPRRLWHRQCMNQGCANEFETTYAPDRPEKVFCDECYKKEIY